MIEDRGPLDLTYKIEQLEKESLILKNESVQLRKELKFLKERIKKLEN